MHICYFDEAGDDGFPNYSSPIFCLSAIYFDHSKWKQIFNEIYEFRKLLKEKYSFPVKMEFHTKQFLLDKNPYRDLKMSTVTKIKLMDEFTNFIGCLDLKIINVVIDKTKIKKQDYQVLDTALTYSIQRIENDIGSSKDSNINFMIITDEGRVGKMRTTTRKIQKINYVPSKFGEIQNLKIKGMIEDPLPKNSSESYFIQIADLTAYLFYLYGIRKLKIGNYPNRMLQYFDDNSLKIFLENLKPALNLAAARSNNYGVKFHPN